VIDWKGGVGQRGAPAGLQGEGAWSAVLTWARAKNVKKCHAGAPQPGLEYPLPISSDTTSPGPRGDSEDSNSYGLANTSWGGGGKPRALPTDEYLHRWRADVDATAACALDRQNARKFAAELPSIYERYREVGGPLTNFLIKTRGTDSCVRQRIVCPAAEEEDDVGGAGAADPSGIMDFRLMKLSSTTPLGRMSVRGTGAPAPPSIGGGRRRGRSGRRAQETQAHQKLQESVVTPPGGAVRRWGIGSIIGVGSPTPSHGVPPSGRQSHAPPPSEEGGSRSPAGPHMGRAALGLRPVKR